jgi:predicted  nucleic acid-binding Zn-ribbon protein
MTISTTLEIQMKEFKPWLEKETTNVLTPLNEQGKKTLEKIKDRMNDFRQACEKLGEEAKKETERGKAVRKAKVTEKLTRHFLRQIERIVFPEKMSFSELERLHRDLEKTLSSIAQERSVWFPRISPSFIFARRRVDFAFTRLAGPITELHSFLSGAYSKARTVEELFLRTDEMMRLLNEMGEYEKRKASVRERLQLLEKQMEEGERSFASIKDSAELGNLAEVNQKAQQLRRQAKHELRHLQKPFIKFAKLARASGHNLSPGEVEKLSQYLKDPFTALATEESGYPKLKSILRRVGKAIDEGRLSLKGSRLKKGREEIDEIVNKNKLDALHHDSVHVFSSIQQLLSSKETQTAQSRSKQLLERLEELRKQREMVGARVEELDKGHEQSFERVGEQKKALEKMVYGSLAKHVDLKL